MMYREQLNDGEPDALGDCCHDVTTLHALNDYHERPRCASTTRRQLAAEPACSRRVTVPTKPGEDGYSRQVGEATTRRESEHGVGRMVRRGVPLG